MLGLTMLKEKLLVQNISGKFRLKKYPFQIPESEVIAKRIFR